MPTRTGYTESSYNIVLSGSDSNFVIGALDSDVLVLSNIDSNMVFNRLNEGASITYINQVDSANNLISNLQAQVAALSGGGPAQSWSS